jgi:hypothetical protein
MVLWTTRKLLKFHQDLVFSTIPWASEKFKECINESIEDDYTWTEDGKKYHLNDSNTNNDGMSWKKIIIISVIALGVAYGLYYYSGDI